QHGKKLLRIFDPRGLAQRRGLDLLALPGRAGRCRRRRRRALTIEVRDCRTGALTPPAFEYELVDAPGQSGHCRQKKDNQCKIHRDACCWYWQAVVSALTTSAHRRVP